MARPKTKDYRTFTLSKKLIERLEKRSIVLGVPKSQIVEAALQEFINERKKVYLSVKK